LSDQTINTIIHGHFYQPPREDPWTNQIEDQDSAKPHKNWNIRITRECYEPNCFSRVLDNKGRIINIINNYEYISFNFGPTLLSWLEKNEPDTYNAILEADKKSLEMHNGHGNAIAQVYNHVIMPLQNYQDKKTQIIWGLKDFEKRFNRKSEGIWLSETAIDYDTVDLLIDFDIRFIILSPDQAKGYKKINHGEWTEVNHHHHINTKRAYKIIRNHGEIAAFYYDKKISTGISFEHLLYNADNFANDIMKGKKHNEIVVIATDGEVYGHHEPFGNMCLAKLINDYHLKNNKIKLINFGEYLDMHSPEYETSLYLGDDGKGSSWSCIHGVGRWYRNCGCHTGGEEGWNQEWRTPLREAFDSLKNKLDEIYQNELSKYVADIWDLRNDYIIHILNDYDIDDTSFLKKHLKNKINEKEVFLIHRLLESQKYALFMYTSCAWFFTELTGIETVQNIKYAYNSIYILGDQYEYLKTNLENDLEKAVSNIKDFNNGKWILNNWIYPSLHDISNIAFNYITLYKTALKDLINIFKIFENFKIKNFNFKKIKNNFFEGNITIINKIGSFYKDYIYLLIQKKSNNHWILIFNKNDKNIFNKAKNDLLKNIFDKNKYSSYDIKIYSNKDLLNDIKRFIVDYTYKDIQEEIIDCGIKLFSNIKQLLINYKDLNLPLPDIFKSFLKLAYKSYFYSLSKTLTSFPDRLILKELIDIFNLLKYFSITPATTILGDKLTEILYDTLYKAHEDLSSDYYKKSLILIEFCNKIDLKIEKSGSENLIFSLLKKNIPILIKKVNESNNNEERSLYILQYRNLIILADNFNINTDNEKKLFFQHFKNLSMFFNKTTS